MPNTKGQQLFYISPLNLYNITPSKQILFRTWNKFLKAITPNTNAGQVNENIWMLGNFSKPLNAGDICDSCVLQGGI